MALSVLHFWVSVLSAGSYTAISVRREQWALSAGTASAFSSRFRAPSVAQGGPTRRVTPQGLKLLRLLVSRPRDVISRKEIAESLWDADVFVDVEQGVNHTIKQVRAALGDDAESPRYVETIPAEATGSSRQWK